MAVAVASRGMAPNNEQSVHPFFRGSLAVQLQLVSKDFTNRQTKGAGSFPLRRRLFYQYHQRLKVRQMFRPMMILQDSEQRKNLLALAPLVGSMAMGRSPLR